MTAAKETKVALRRRIFDLEAQIASRAAFASDEVGKAGDCFTGSAVILHLTALGGRDVVRPVAIRDGLSAATIEALRADIRRSYELATQVKPK